MPNSEIIARFGRGETAEQIAAWLPTTAAWWRPLTSVEALRWLTLEGRLVAAEEAVANPAMPAKLRSAIKGTFLATARTDTTLDLSPLSEDRELLLGCVQAGIFDGDDVAALIESTRLRPDPTAADVQAVIDAHEREQAIEAVRERWENAKSAAVLAASRGEDADAAGLAVIQGEG